MQLQPQSMTIVLKVIEAYSLKAADFHLIVNSSDPFAKLSYYRGGDHIASKSVQTTVIIHNINPIWNELFEFDFKGPEDEISIEVWDKKLISDTFLGQARVQVGKIMDCKHWTPLLPRTDHNDIGIRGKICLTAYLKST